MKTDWKPINKFYVDNRKELVLWTDGYCHTGRRKEFILGDYYWVNDAGTEIYPTWFTYLTPPEEK